MRKFVVEAEELPVKFELELFITARARHAPVALVAGLKLLLDLRRSLDGRRRDIDPQPVAAHQETFLTGLDHAEGIALPIEVVGIFVNLIKEGLADGRRAEIRSRVRNGQFQ